MDIDKALKLERMARAYYGCWYDSLIFLSSLDRRIAQESDEKKRLELYHKRDQALKISENEYHKCRLLFMQLCTAIAEFGIQDLQIPSLISFYTDPENNISKSMQCKVELEQIRLRLVAVRATQKAANAPTKTQQSDMFENLIQVAKEITNNPGQKNTRSLARRIGLASPQSHKSFNNVYSKILKTAGFSCGVGVKSTWIPPQNVPSEHLQTALKSAYEKHLCESKTKR